jgi:ATP-binding protein involved in chromosome partitioning
MANNEEKISIDPQALQKSLMENMKKIKHKIMVISGKGGVGKSTVAVNLAFGLAQKGKKVGILDIDLHGPSLAKMMGIEGNKPPERSGINMIPPEVDGVKMMSNALMLEHNDSPIIWRGPLKTTAIKQLLALVEWGELDYLIIDSPPGTGDEPLSICQNIPGADGTIIVTTPQDIALLDSRKAVKFSQLLGVPVLGIIENMSGMICPHCQKPIDLFKSGGGKRAAMDLKVPFLGKIPIELEVVESTDSGKPLLLAYKDSPAAVELLKIVDKIIERLSLREIENERKST